jgi:hypothetical protein
MKEQLDAKIESENNRHMKYLADAGTGTMSQQKRLTLLQEIGDIVQSRKDEEQSLEDLLDRIGQEYSREINEIQSTLENARSTTEISRLIQEKELLHADHAVKMDNLRQTLRDSEAEMYKRIESDRKAGGHQLNILEERLKCGIDQFEKYRLEIEGQMTISREQFQKNRSDFIGNADRRIHQLTESQFTKVSAIVHDFEQFRAQLIKNGAAFQKRLKDSCSQYQSLIDEFIRTSKCETDKRNRDWYEMRTFYDEKTSVLTRKKDETQREYQMQPPRQTEIDIIERLEAMLHTKVMQLQNAVRDYQEYRKLRVDQEKSVSHRFGRPPKIGVFGPTVKTSH